MKHYLFIILTVIILSACAGGEDVTASPPTDTKNTPSISNLCTGATPATLNSRIEDFRNQEYHASGRYKTETGFFFGDYLDYDANRKSALDAIGASTAYACADLATDSTVMIGGKGQIVSILDSVVATSHPEFLRDGDESVFIEGYNAIDGSNDVTCDSTNCGSTHGSHVAGIIAAGKNKSANWFNDLNMHGVAYHAKIKPVAIFEDSSRNPNNNQGKIATAIRAGAGIDSQGNVVTKIVAMNNSWGPIAQPSCAIIDNTAYYVGRPPNEGLLETDCSTIRSQEYYVIEAELVAWKQAVNAGTVIVFAAGNDGWNTETGKVRVYSSSNLANTSFVWESKVYQNQPAWRATLPAYDVNLKSKWLNVVATDNDGVITTFSNGCGVSQSYCLAAPGMDILSAYGSSDESYEYNSISGTSMATPHVTGALAVLKAMYPSLSGEELTQLVLETATYIKGDTDGDGDKDADDEETDSDGDGKPDYNPVYGHGLLNLDAASNPVGITFATTSNNQALSAEIKDSSITLASHFGTETHELKVGMRDKYNRSFTTSIAQMTLDPITIGIDNYMAEFTNETAVNTQNIGVQTQVNFSSSASDTWMNLQYQHGNSNFGISFHDGFALKAFPVNRLVDEAVILRAHNIRPAGSDVAQMNMTHRLGNNLSLSTYIATGEYDTENKFDELGADILLSIGKNSINLGVGNLHEHDQFFGAETTGAYGLEQASVSQFADVTVARSLTDKLTLSVNYISYKNDVTMLHDSFANIEGLEANQYQIALHGSSLIQDDDSLDIALATKFGVTDGDLIQHTTLGYNGNEFNNVTQSYDLAITERHQQLSVTYQGKLATKNEHNANLLSDNRFFTTLIIDNNLYHQAGVNQVEIITGVKVQF